MNLEDESKDESMKDDKTVVSDMLFFVRHKLATTSNDDLLEICADFYPDEYVLKEKERFFKSVDKKPVRRRAVDKKERDLRDIFVEMRARMDAGESLPSFLAENLENLPGFNGSSSPNSDISDTLREIREEAVTKRGLRSALSTLKTELIQSMETAPTRVPAASSSTSASSSISASTTYSTPASSNAEGRLSLLSTFDGSVIDLDPDMNYIHFKVHYGDNKFHYRMNKSSSFQKLVELVCGLTGHQSLTFVVSHDASDVNSARIVTERDTPKTACIVDGDILRVNARALTGEVEESYDGVVRRAIGASPNVINFIVLVEGNFFRYKMKKSAKLKKLIKTFTKLADIGPRPLRFIHCGCPVFPSSTPLASVMEEGEAVEVFGGLIAGPVPGYPLKKTADGERVMWAESISSNSEYEAGSYYPRNPFVCLKVVCNGNVIFFKIRKHVPLEKMTRFFCELANLNRDSVGFLLNGEPVSDKKTPEEFNLKDGDSLLVVGGTHRDELTVRVKAVYEDKVFPCTIKKDTALKNLIKLVCGRAGLDREEVVFTYDCRRLRGSDTPMTLNMKDGDSVDVYKDRRSYLGL